MEDKQPYPPEATGLPQGPHFPVAVSSPLIRLVQQPSGLVLEINRADFIMGRHSECEIRLPLPDVSRRHCRFRYENGVWTVIDLQSLNGVFVNEQPVDRAELRQGDRLRVAGFMFLIDLTGVAAQAAAEGLPALSEALFQNRHRPNTVMPQRRAS